MKEVAVDSQVVACRTKVGGSTNFATEGIPQDTAIGWGNMQAEEICDASTKYPSQSALQILTLGFRNKVADHSNPLCRRGMGTVIEARDVTVWRRVEYWSSFEYPLEGG